MQTTNLRLCLRKQVVGRLSRVSLWLIWIDIWLFGMQAALTEAAELGAQLDVDGAEYGTTPLTGRFHAYIEGCAAARISPKGNSLHLGEQEENAQKVRFFLTESADVKMELFNLITGTVDSFSYTQKNMKAGSHVQTIELSELHTGVYICKITIGEETLTTKFFVK